MSTNKGFTLQYKTNNDSYVPLYPRTIQDQILNWGIGEVYGPYTFVLSAENWVNNQQTINFNGITANDILNCVKVLSGTEAEMKAQDDAYSLLSPTGGIQSANNQVIFTCDSTPPIDIQVQIWWTK